jgi:hypothetical protein
MDRILPDEFREQWRTLDERAEQHKERERKQAEKAAAAKRPPPPRVCGPGQVGAVFISDALCLIICLWDGSWAYHVWEKRLLAWPTPH